MNEHVIGSTAEKQWALAVDQAVRDKAVAVFFTLNRLLRQLPHAIRWWVRQEMGVLGPLPLDSFYCIAYVLRDDLPPGTCAIWQRADRPDVCWFLTVVDQAAYEAAILRIEDLLMKQREMSPCN